MIGAFFMLAGAALLAGAMFLVLNNRQEDQTAQTFSQTIMPELHSEVLQAQQLRESLPTEPEAELVDYIPVEYLSPEDLIMTEKTINGYAYIGYLTIPDLNLELPVMSGWDSRRLQISPCRFTGTLRGEDLVIMAHNYNSHFGRLSKLTEGAQIIFTDMDGNVWHYGVAAMDILPAEAVEEMTAGEYDLTLFTCAPNRTQRITVRCNKADT
jgi:sortase A